MNLSTFVDLMLTIIAFGVVIFVHELGHFVAAKLVGIKVEQFAIGFGPAALAWRKGIGFRVGTTTPELLARVKSYHAGNAPDNRAEASSEHAAELSPQEQDAAVRALGMGETEYRLNYLPLGGYVKMLGQDDTSMAHRVADPRSFSGKSIPARVIVISAGVIMNMIFAVLLFIGCYMHGVQTVPAVIGNVDPDSVAAAAVPLDDQGTPIANAPVGIRPGDEIQEVNGKKIGDFTDLAMSAALARPDQDLNLTIRRGDAIIHFVCKPRTSQTTKLLALGVQPTFSNVVRTDLFAPGSDATPEYVHKVLTHAGLPDVTLLPGMTLATVNGEPIKAIWQFSRAIDESSGGPLTLTFVAPTTADRTDTNSKDNPRVPPVQTGTIVPESELQLAQRNIGMDQYVSVNHMLGLAPVVSVGIMTESQSRLLPQIHTGDLILRANNLDVPREDQLAVMLSQLAGQSITLTVQRDGNIVPDIEVQVGNGGAVGFQIATDSTAPAIVAQGPLSAGQAPYLMTDDATVSPRSSSPATTVSPQILAKQAQLADLKVAVPLNLMPGVEITAVNGAVVKSWNDLERALRKIASQSVAGGSDTPVTASLTYRLPLKDTYIQTSEWSLPAASLKRLSEIGWQSWIYPSFFEPLRITTKATGPADATMMGLSKTWQTTASVYLTIDRLFRGSVQVSQLKGPVGIAQLGTQVAHEGILQLLIFIAIINVNLAVLNALPIPLTDGGLMAFLMVEAVKGSPVSDRVQNIATYIGLALLGALVLVTFYHDVLNLMNSILH